MTTDLIPKTLPPDITVPVRLPGTTIVVSGALVAQIDDLYEEMTDAPQIIDQSTMDTVRDIMARARTLVTQIDGARAAAKSPFAAIGKAIDAAAKQATTRLEEIITEAKGQTEDFLRERDRQMAELERQRRAAEAIALAEQAAALAAGQPTRPTAPLPIIDLPPAAVKAPTQTRQVVEITDPLAIPREYLVPDMVRIRKDALAGAAIPGVIVKTETFVVAR